MTSTAPGDVGARAQADAAVRLEQPHGEDAAATPIGRLTKKIQCQLTAWVRTPPASRPIEAPAEATKL